MEGNPAIGCWYKDGYFWRKTNADGSDGKGDLIFNTCKKIYTDQDRSNWAYSSLDACHLLLWDGKRWPNRMNKDAPEKDVNSWARRIINRTLNKLFGMSLPYRFQGRMTRDPFIAWYNLAIYLDESAYVEQLRMPWYIYSPKTWRWRRRLIKDTRKDFVIELDYLRWCASKMRYEKTR